MNLPTHVVIPDTQCKPGAPTEHLTWIGRYLVDQFYGKDNVKVIHLGDHWDMPSLSSYDKGTKSMEGRRYLEDIQAGNEGMEALMAPLVQRNKHKAANKERQWRPQFHLLRGNHEDRIRRATELDAQLEGLLTMDHLKAPGWKVHDFLDVVELDGVGYSHFFANPMSGKPYGGAAATRLKTVGYSFTMGHQQTLDYALRFLSNGQSQHALIAGACYLHDEDYKGSQGNHHWRGIIVKHRVIGGSYDPMFVSLDYLRERYG